MPSRPRVPAAEWACLPEQSDEAQKLSLVLGSTPGAIFTLPAQPAAVRRSLNFDGLLRTHGRRGFGKSTVARMFEELGAKVIDADRIGHELLGSTQPPYNEIVRRF